MFTFDIQKPTAFRQDFLKHEHLLPVLSPFLMKYDENDNKNTLKIQYEIITFMYTLHNY
jgi:hypothetical protein